MEFCRSGVCTGTRSGKRYFGGKWCHGCYGRWRRAGKPDSGPPAQGSFRASSARTARLEDYQFLRSLGLSRTEAAARLQVCERTVLRYERSIREAAA